MLDKCHTLRQHHPPAESARWISLLSRHRPPKLLSGRMAPIRVEPANNLLRIALLPIQRTTQCRRRGSIVDGESNPAARWLDSGGLLGGAGADFQGGFRLGSIQSKGGKDYSPRV